MTRKRGERGVGGRAKSGASELSLSPHHVVQGVSAYAAEAEAREIACRVTDLQVCMRVTMHGATLEMVNSMHSAGRLGVCRPACGGTGQWFRTIF